MAQNDCVLHPQNDELIFQTKKPRLGAFSVRVYVLERLGLKIVRLNLTI